MRCVRGGFAACAALCLLVALGGCSKAVPPAATPNPASPAATSTAAPEDTGTSTGFAPYPGASAPVGVYSSASGKTVVVGVLDVQVVKTNTVSNVQARVVADTAPTSGLSRPIARLDVPDSVLASVQKLNGKRVAIDGVLSDAAVAGQTPFLTVETVKPAPAP